MGIDARLACAGAKECWPRAKRSTRRRRSA